MRVLFFIFFLIQELNWLAIGISTLIMFMGGAFWHGPLFGKLWMKIHHGDKKFTDAENKKMMEGMWKLMLTEFIMSLLIIIGLTCVVRAIPQYSGIQTAFMVWLAFILPTLTSSILWGNDEKKWMCTKIAVTGSYRLLSLLLAGYLLSIM